MIQAHKIFYQPSRELRCDYYPSELFHLGIILGAMAGSLYFVPLSNAGCPGKVMTSGQIAEAEPKATDR